MKKAFSYAMKKGSEVEKKEQWEVFSKTVEDFSSHICANKDKLVAQNSVKKGGLDGGPSIEIGSMSFVNKKCE